MAQLQRIVRGRSATLTHTFYSDVTATDPSPDTTTVTITRDDGTAVVTGASATEAGTGIVTYTVTPAQTALLDRWTVTWTATFGGQSQAFAETVEVAGDVLFTLSEAGAIKLGAGADTLYPRYTTAQIAAMRVSVEQAIEEEYGVALVPRYERESLNGQPWNESWLRLKWPEIRAVREASISGTALTLTDVQIDDILGVYYSAGWTLGRSNVIVGYEHGLDRPPERIKRGGLLLLKRWLVEGPVDDRTTSMSNTEGTWSLATPGRGGSIFGLPELDAAIMASPYRVGIA